MAHAGQRVYPLVVVGEPPTFVNIRDADELELAQHAFAVQWAFVHGRATEDELLGFLGFRVDGRLIEVDPDVLEEWARRGEFDLAEVYQAMFS